MSLSHQSAFNSPAAGATVSGYYGSYNNHYTDFYGAEHLDFAQHQTPSHHQHGPYSSFPAAPYGMLTALQGGGGTGAAPWYEHCSVEPLDTGFSRFDIAGSTAFRRLPVSAATVDVKPETILRMPESGTGRSGGRSACRELSGDVDVSFSMFMAIFFTSRSYLQGPLVSEGSLSKLALTRTPDPIRPTRRGRGPNQTMRRGIFARLVLLALLALIVVWSGRTLTQVNPRTTSFIFAPRTTRCLQEQPRPMLSCGVCMCVCLYVCLSVTFVYILSKRINISTNFLHLRVAKPF